MECNEHQQVWNVLLVGWFKQGSDFEIYFPKWKSEIVSLSIDLISNENDFDRNSLCNNWISLDFEKGIDYKKNFRTCSWWVFFKEDFSWTGRTREVTRWRLFMKTFLTTWVIIKIGNDNMVKNNDDNRTSGIYLLNFFRPNF